MGDIAGDIGSQNQPVQTIIQSCMVLFLLRIESIVDDNLDTMMEVM